MKTKEVLKSVVWRVQRTSFLANEWNFAGLPLPLRRLAKTQGKTGVQQYIDDTIKASLLFKIQNSEFP
jgi:hypothetical protein